MDQWLHTLMYLFTDSRIQNWCHKAEHGGHTYPRGEQEAYQADERFERQTG